jgi:hypothetical protein
MNFTGSCFSTKSPPYEDLAKYGIDIVNYPKTQGLAIGQKGEIRKTVAEFRTAYSKNKSTMTVM